jgi:hypothetical protein
MKDTIYEGLEDLAYGMCIYVSLSYLYRFFYICSINQAA